MNSEEIKAMGLHEGDVVDATMRVTVSAIQPESPLLEFATKTRAAVFWCDPEELIAIKRIAPALPTGWTWASTTTEPEVIARAKGPAGNWATVDYRGRLNGKQAIPALVAKALLEAWGQTQ